MPKIRDQWKTRIGFVWVAAGSAVGLGNIWRFPYVVGENGGSVFILIYIAFVLILGMPIIIAEMALGKLSQKSPVGAFQLVVGPRSAWQIAGYLGAFAALLILSFYSVVASWCVSFAIKTFSGELTSGRSGTEIGAMLTSLRASASEQILLTGGFLLTTLLIVLGGVRKGLQRWCAVLMPAMIVILLGLSIYAMRQPNAREGLEFLLRPALGKLKVASLLAAMGQCFFSLSIGMGVMITYGSYLSREQGVARLAGWVVFLDTMVALLAGFVVFPLVFSFGQTPEQGPGLVFVTLPLVFSSMPGGAYFASAFFVLLIFAALTSTISLLEVLTALCMDEFGMKRLTAAVLFSVISFFIAILCATSEESFDFISAFSSNYLLPLGALLISLFVGWRIQPELLKKDLRGTWSLRGFMLWRVIVSIVCPVLVLLVFLDGAGLLSAFIIE